MAEVMLIVDDEEPSYKAFADMVAPTGEPGSPPAFEPPTLEAPAFEPPAAEVSAAEVPAVEVFAESAEPESGEILDADELIDSMTPACLKLLSVLQLASADPVGMDSGFRCRYGFPTLRQWIVFASRRYV